MARVTEGARTQLSGKADGLVYVQSKWGVYTRKLPRRKKDASTPGMLQNLERFKLINTFCAQFKHSLIPQIWNGRNPRMSGYALFLKTNTAAFGMDGSISDARKIKLSTGDLHFPAGFEAKRSETDSNQIVVSWPKEMQVGGIHLMDELLVISCEEGKYSEIMNTGIERNDLGGTFELPVTMPPAPRQPSSTTTGGQASSMPIYLFFVSKNRREYSESACVEV